MKINAIYIVSLFINNGHENCFIMWLITCVRVRVRVTTTPIWGGTGTNAIPIL
eukprot:m.57998 g.57998  ORF g.57998 m.57998 type:complete len:53 (-) comp7846_c1_seq1:1237-1395(-)